MVLARNDRLGRAREAFRAGRWSDACTDFAAADEQDLLGTDDLDRFAAAQYLVGREMESIGSWTRAFHAAREQDPPRAVRYGFWVGFVLLNRGDLPAGNGWITRLERALADLADDAVEAGYVRYLVALRSIFEGGVEHANTLFDEVARLAQRSGDRNLETLARLGHGRALIRLGRPRDGVACLDEAIVTVASGEVSPIVVGDGYCTAIEGCQELFDLHRARRWTEDLTRWCDEHPELVAFRGQCLLHRAEILRLRGSWPDAQSQVARALAHRARPTGQLAAGAAYYQQGELHRLRGDVEHAEAAYAEARRRGRQPQPGLALLRLADGQVSRAEAAIRRALAETEEATLRSSLLPAAVEILLAAGDPEAARRACEELETTAAGFGSQLLHAVAEQSRAMVQLAAGEPETALRALRRSLGRWHALGVPYEAARVQVLIGQASRLLGDEEETQAEWATARETFVDLGARTDVERLDALAGARQDRDRAGLSRRQLEVLRCLARGRTNREIADLLVISPRTVERHVSDIFTKLQVSSRAAATAYAYEHELL